MSDFDRILDHQLESILDETQRQALSISQQDIQIYDLLRYHLGRVDKDLQVSTSYPGKRIRPRLAVLAFAAVADPVERAYPLAAAIELIHNFTLIHDDVQDRSHERRHRPTIWSLWGDGQAINAGDAMFVVAHLALTRLAADGDSRRTLELSTWLHQTTLRIVEGQTLDLSFERRDDVTAQEYLNMIGGKTAAIMRFASGAGAYLAGADSVTVERFGDFGEALGVGFQIQDDLLGVWGATEETGKPVADDIRRSKKAFPLILLTERATQAERRDINDILESDPVPEHGVMRILDMMRCHGVRESAVDEVTRRHDLAAELLDTLDCPAHVRGELSNLVDALSSRVA